MQSNGMFFLFTFPRDKGTFTACHWLADTDLLPLSTLEFCVLYNGFLYFFLDIVIFFIDLIMTNLMYVIVYAF